MSNIDGTMGHKIKTTANIQDMEHCVILYQLNRNPGQTLQENAITVFGPREQLVAKISERHRKC